MEIFEQFAEEYGRTKLIEMTLQDYLLGCREDPTMRAMAADRTQQVKNLLTLFQTLTCVTEKTDDTLNGLLDTVYVTERPIAFEGPVEKIAT